MSRVGERMRAATVLSALWSSESERSPCFGATRPNAHQQTLHFLFPRTFCFISQPFWWHLLCSQPSVDGTGLHGAEWRPSLPLRGRVRLRGEGEARRQREGLATWTGQVGEVAHTLTCEGTDGP